MQTYDPLLVTLDLEAAIDPHPLIVSPETLLVEAIALMSQTRGTSCLLTSLNASSNGIPSREFRSSCVLVMEKSQLIGILTERDLVRLTANNINFKGLKIGEVMVQPVITLKEASCKDIFAPLFLFRRYKIRHLPIVDDRDRLIGVVSPESIRQVLRPANLLKLRRVSEVMTTQVIHAPMTTSVLNLARLMARKLVSCVVITQADGEDGVRPVGIVTERDIVQFQSLQLNLSKLQAQGVMSTPLFLVSPEDSLWTVHEQMQRRRVHRLVVSWNWGRGLGIVTQTNLLRVFDSMEMYGVIETLQKTVRQLEAEKAELLQISNGKQKHFQLRSLSAREPLAAVESNLACRNGTFSCELNNLLSKLQVCIESLANEPELSCELRQRQLNSALADVDRMRQLLQGS